MLTSGYEQHMASTHVTGQKPNQFKDSAIQRWIMQDLQSKHNRTIVLHQGSTSMALLWLSLAQGCPQRLHEIRVQCFRMRNITLSADDDLIEQARLVARAQRKTLNAAFRAWLLQFTAQSGNGQEVDGLMRRLRHVSAGHRFTRDEMNER